MLVLARCVAFVDPPPSHLIPGSKAASAVVAEQGRDHQQQELSPCLGTAKPCPGPVFTPSPSSPPSSHYNLCV